MLSVAGVIESDGQEIGEEIDEEIAEFVRVLQADYGRYADLPSAAHPRRREIAADVRKRWSEGGPMMAQREDFEVEGPAGPMRLRLLSPGVEPRQPAMLYIHGGGFTSFSIDTHDRVMREYADGFGGAVIGIDYSLSPEAKFPVALEELSAAVDWLVSNASILGVDIGRLGIGGDSAGANLAVATCLRLRDRGEDGRFRAMILNYGFFGPDLETASGRRHGGEDKLLTNVELQDYIDHYLGGTEHGRSPLAWPLLADLHALPPSFHAIAECDPLVDADLAMVEKLRRAGNDATSIVYTGATHSFLEAVSISKIARQAFSDQTVWLKHALRPA